MFTDRHTWLASVLNSLRRFALLAGTGAWAVVISQFAEDPPLWLDLLSQFVWQAFWAALVACAAMLTIRRWWSAIYIGAAAVAAAIAVIPWWFDHKPAVAERAFKVVLANVQTSNRKYRRVLKYIRAEDPDIVAVFEVDDGWLYALSSLEQRYPHHKGFPAEDNFGIALYSKFPFPSMVVRYFGARATAAIDGKIDIKGSVIRFIAVHPVPPINDNFFAERNEHYDALVEEVSRSTNPVLLVGDLNTTMWSPYYKSLTARTGLHNVRQGFGVEGTWPAFAAPFNLPIDHALIDYHFHVVDVIAGPDVGSDHLPLSMVLDVAAGDTYDERRIP